MFKSIRNTIVSSFIVILFISCNTFAQVKVGILPRLSPAELTKMFNPLVEYASAEIGQKIELVIPKDFETFNQMIKEGKFDYAYANPNIYIDARASLGNKVEPLVLSVETGSGKSFTGCFLVKKGSSIKSVSDFKGKKMIFVDQKSAGGYISQAATLVNCNIHKKDITLLPFALKHTNVALAVQNGAADIGGIRTADYDKIKNQVNIPDVVILSESEQMPNWPFFKLPNSKDDVTEKLKAALIKLAPKSAKSNSVLKDAKLDGFVPTSDVDFDGMRKVAELLKKF
ncbi:MAG: phosphate/phosphite/phosphonate ABC transporter substrate-binding protein [Melioribacteraceae bacterium]